MKQISQNLLNAFNSNEPIYQKKVLLYTRVWNNLTNTYTFSTAQDITPYILEISKIKWKLDNEGYSIWNTPTVAITLSMVNNNLFDNNIFLYGSKIDFLCSATTKKQSVENQNMEFVKIFQGFLLTDPIISYSERTITLNLSGQLALLDKISAQSISQISSQEVLTQIDLEDFTLFKTAQKAVGSILLLQKQTTNQNETELITLKEEDDFTINNLNQYNKEAQIILKQSLVSGESLICTYRYWYTDKTSQWLCNQIADLYGASSRQIDDVFFSSSVEASFQAPTKTSFSEGSSEYCTITDNQVSLQDNFITPTNYNWTILTKPDGCVVETTPSSITVDGLFLRSPVIVSAESSLAYGSWQAVVSSPVRDEHHQNNYFISSTNDINNTCGYCFEFEAWGDYLIFTLYRVENGNKIEVQNWAYEIGFTATRLEYRISRNSLGEFRVFARGIAPSTTPWRDLERVYTDNKYTTSNYQIFEMTDYGNNHVISLKTSPQASMGYGDIAPYGTYYSPAIFAGNTLIRWNKVNFLQQLNEGTGKVFIRFKNLEDLTWQNWEEVINNQTITSSYNTAQLKWEGVSNNTQTESPILNNLNLYWEIRGVNIAMVNTQQMSCLDVMKELALLSGYQIGFDSEGKFLFVNRNQTISQLTLSKADLIELESLEGGADKLYTRVQVNFGAYSTMLDAFTQAEPRPNLIDKFGVKELVISSGTFLPAQNANLARAAAPDIYARACVLKKRAVLLVRFLPYIELGDILTINLDNMLNATMRVDGLEFDLETWALRLNLTEV